MVPDPGPGHALVVREGLPALPGVPGPRSGLPGRDAPRPARRTSPPVARRLARRRRSTGARDRRPHDPHHDRLRGDVRAVLLPGADRGAPVGAARLPRAVAPAGGGGRGRWHVRRTGARLQRGPRRGGRLPRLPAAVRHAGVAARSAASVPAGARAADRGVPAHLRPVHGPRVRALGLAGDQLVHALAAGRARQPGSSAAATRRSLRTHTDPRAQRRARLDHDPGRGRHRGPAVPAVEADPRREQLPRDGRRRHRRLRRADPAPLRPHAGALAARTGAHAGCRRCGRSGRSRGSCATYRRGGVPARPTGAGSR